MNMALAPLNQIDPRHYLLQNEDIKKNQEILKNDVIIDIRNENLDIRDATIHIEKQNVVVEGRENDTTLRERPMSERWIWRKLDKVLFLTCTIGGIFLFIQVPAFISQFKLVVAGYQIAIDMQLSGMRENLSEIGVKNLLLQQKQLQEFATDMAAADIDPHLFSRFHVMFKHFHDGYFKECFFSNLFHDNRFAAIQLSPTVFTKEILAFAAAGALAGYGVYLLTGRLLPAVVRRTSRAVKWVFRSGVSRREPPRAPIRTKVPDNQFKH